MPPPLTPSKMHHEDSNHHPRTSEHNFHRPFERPLTNGFERNHFTEYERRLMTESILAQDRQLSVLQDNRPRSRPNSGHSQPESRNYDHMLNDRSYLEKQHAEGIQARLIESEKSHHSHIRKLTQYEYDRPHAEYSYHLNSYNNENKDSSSLPHSNKETRTQDLTNSSNNFLRHEPQSHSKLDLEEKRIREARMNGEYNSDESENEADEECGPEERKRQRLLLVTNGPPLKLDTSPKKMKFLKDFGLTSKQKRRGKHSHTLFLTLVCAHILCSPW